MFLLLFIGFWYVYVTTGYDNNSSDLFSAETIKFTMWGCLVLTLISYLMPKPSSDLSFDASRSNARYTSDIVS